MQAARQGGGGVCRSVRGGRQAGALVLAERTASTTGQGGSSRATTTVCQVREAGTHILHRVPSQVRETGTHILHRVPGQVRETGTHILHRAVVSGSCRKYNSITIEYINNVIDLLIVTALTGHWRPMGQQDSRGKIYCSNLGSAKKEEKRAKD